MPRVSPCRAIRALLPCALAVGVISACSASAEEPEGLATPSPVAGTPTDVPTEPSAEHEVSALWYDYWDSVVAAENDLDTDPGRLSEVMTDDAVLQQIAFIEGLAANDLFRAGEPHVGEPIIDLDDDSAVVEGCVDHTDWPIGSSEGARVQQPVPPGPQPFVLDIERRDDTWLAARARHDPEASITCEP